MYRSAVPPSVVALLCGLAVAGCSNEPVYDATSQAPDPSAYRDSEESPSSTGGVVRLDLDNGSVVALWIDPDDIRAVYEQHSDPDDADAWTKPELLYTAGDGCLFIKATTDGTTVGATLGCYEGDAWIQQAPDQGQAVASSDLVDWDVQDAGELFVEPQVSQDKVTWADGPTWTEDDGFS